MKFLALLLILTTAAWGKSEMSHVSKQILAEENLKAAQDFEASIAAECPEGTQDENCAQLRDFIKTQKYNAKIELYGFYEKQAKERALARQSEIDCVEKLQKYFTEKGYPFNGSETCEQLSAALLVHKPPTLEEE